MSEWKEATLAMIGFIVVMLAFLWAESQYGCASALHTPDGKCVTTAASSEG